VESTYTPLLTLVILSIIILSLPLLPYHIVIDDRGFDQFDLDRIINDVTTRLHLNRSDPEIYYELYYSGRVLVFNATGIPQVIGKSPLSISFGYYDGRYRSTLPIRVFDRSLHSSMTNIYIMPKTINNRTKIMIKLPRTYP